MAKKQSLAVNDHVVPKGSNLDISEHELADALVDHFEAFYRQGVILERIKNDQEFKDANFKSFDEYMDQRMPLGIKKSYAWRLIAAKKIRPLLPNIDSPMGESVPWSERAMRPLTHSSFTPADVKRLGKKIATRVHKGAPLSDRLVKEVCDDDRGVERKAKVRKAKLFKQASLASNLELAIELVIGLRVGFENYYEDAWYEVEEANPGLIKSLVTELDNLTSFLKE
jgi:hypothetical protein